MRDALVASASMAPRRTRIAITEGAGIGNEVEPVGVAVLGRLAELRGGALRTDPVGEWAVDQHV